MRRFVLMAIVAGGVFYAPLPLIAQKGGGETPLIPVADIPNDSGGATAPSEVPLEVNPEEAPELVPPQQVNNGGGTSAPAPAATQATPPPAPAPSTPEPSPTPVAAQAPEEPDTPVEEPPDETPTETPTTPEPDEDEPDPEEFEEEFDEGPAPGEPESPAVTVPEVSAGPQLPRTGPELPAIVLSGLSLTAAGMALRALARERA